MPTISNNIPENVLYNCLKEVSQYKRIKSYTDSNYREALATIGLIEAGWDDTLTPLGQTILDLLDNKRW